MPELIQKKGDRFESSLENIDEELDWVKKQIQRELSGLQKGIEETQIKNSFFEKEGKTVSFNVALVKQYLQSCVQKDDFQINSAVIMATQIALEVRGYDVGKIDGLLKKNSGKESGTEKAIKSFQRKNGLKVDGVPGKKTIEKILGELGNVKKLDNNGGKKDSKEGNKLDKKNLLALEIYRGKRVTNEEIINMGYDPKEIWNLVYNKELMEYYDNVVSKLSRNNKVNNKGSEKSLKNSKDDVDVDVKKDHREVSPNIKPLINNKTGNVENLSDILEAENLELPKLKATSVNEIGGLGNSMMHGFQWYGKDVTKHFSYMIGEEGASTTTHIKRFKSEEHVIQYHKNHPDIKSFVLYFGGNTSNNEQTLNDLKNWAEWLSKAGIQPVLCTNIGVNSHVSKDQKYKEVDGKWLKPLNNDIRKLVEDSNGKYKLIDFAKVDDVIDKAGDKIHPKSYALMHDIIYKCIEK